MSADKLLRLAGVGQNETLNHVGRWLDLQRYQKTKTNMFVSEKSRGQFQRLQGGQHFALEILVMLIQRMNVFWRTSAFGAADSGQHRLEYFLAQDQQARQRADARPAHPVAARAADPLDQRLTPQLAQVVRGLTRVVAGPRAALLPSHSVRQLRGGEAARPRR